MAIEDACEHDMLVQIRWQGRKMAIPLSQLAAIDQTNQPTKPSATGTTGWPRATASDLHTTTESSRAFSMSDI
jgi:Calcium binding